MNRMMYYPNSRMKRCCCNAPKLADCEASMAITALKGKCGFIKYDKRKLQYYGDVYDDEFAAKNAYGLSFISINNGNDYRSIANGTTILNGTAERATGSTSFNALDAYEYPDYFNRYFIIHHYDSLKSTLWYCDDYSSPNFVAEDETTYSSNRPRVDTHGYHAFMSVYKSTPLGYTIETNLFYKKNSIDKGISSFATPLLYGRKAIGLVSATPLNHRFYWENKNIHNDYGYPSDARGNAFYTAYANGPLYYENRHIGNNASDRNFASFSRHRYFCLQEDYTRARHYRNGKQLDVKNSYGSDLGLAIAEAGGQIQLGSAFFWYDNEVFYANSDSTVESYGNYMVTRWQGSRSVLYEGKSVFGPALMLQDATYSDYDTLAFTIDGRTALICMYAGNILHDTSGELLSVAGKSIAIKDGNHLKIFHEDQTVHDRQHDLIERIPSRNGTLFVRADDDLIIYDEDYGLLVHRLSQLV